MTDLTRTHMGLLRDTLGTGIKGTRPTRNILSFFLQEKYRGEVAELVAMGLLARSETPATGGPVITHAATEKGITVLLDNQQGK